MTGDPARPPRHGLIERLGERRKHHMKRSRVYRIGFAIAGAVVTLAGIAMLALPGPAFVVIPIGLAMLAMEFSWAERWLHTALVKAADAQHRAAHASTTQKVLGGVAAALAAAAFAAAAVLWNIPLVPVL